MITIIIMMIIIIIIIVSHSENYPRSKVKKVPYDLGRGGKGEGIHFSWSFRDKGSNPPLCFAK